MVNKGIVIRANLGNDVFRIQDLAPEGSAQLNHAPEHYRVRNEAGFTERCGKDKEAGDVGEKIKSCGPDAQILIEELECAHKEQDDEHTYTQKERNRYSEVKRLFQSIIFPQL